MHWTYLLCSHMTQLQSSQGDTTDGTQQRINAIYKLMSIIVFDSVHLDLNTIKTTYSPKIYSLLGQNNKIFSNEFMNIALDAVIETQARLS